jgi:hypothetical protein
LALVGACLLCYQPPQALLAYFQQLLCRDDDESQEQQQRQLLHQRLARLKSQSLSQRPPLSKVDDETETWMTE